MPKCDLVVNGERLLERLGQLLARCSAAVAVVGRRPSPAGLGSEFVCIPDERPGMGPLAGIAAGLRYAVETLGQGAGAIVVSCDAVGLGAELLDCLLAARDSHAAATVLVNPCSGRIEPLPGIYEAAAAGSIERALQEGRLSVSDWLREADAARPAARPELARQFDGANTPEELAARSSPEGPTHKRSRG